MKIISMIIAATFTLLAQTAFAQNNYQIRNGDVLRVEVIEDPSLNRSVLVSQMDGSQCH